MVYTIDTDADVFGIDRYTPNSWIVRDDNGDFWTIFRNLSGNLEIHKSTDDGVTWTNIKTLTNSDFTDNPFPTSRFQIENLEGQDKVYIITWKLMSGTLKFYSCYIDINSNTVTIDLDGATDSTIANSEEYKKLRWNYYYQRLELIYNHKTASYINGIEIPLTGAFSTKRSYETSIKDHRDSDFDRSDGKWLGWVNDSNNKQQISYNNSFYNQLVDSSSSDILNNDIKWISFLLSRQVTKRVIRFAVYYDSGSSTYRFVINQDKWNGSSFTREIYDDQAIPTSNTNPLSAWAAIDTNDNIYIFWTDGSDNECYCLKYDQSPKTWGTHQQLSSGSKGLLIMPERYVPASSDKVIFCYQEQL